MQSVAESTRGIMPRKSQAKRLEEGRALSILYTEAGLTTSWEYGFLASIVEQLERGKYPSKRQRIRFDDLIAEGVPKPQGDQKLLAQIDAAIEFWNGNPDRDWDSGILRDLRRNVFKGWNISEKQQGLLDKLLQRCEDDKSGLNDFTPTNEQIDDLRILINLHRGYADQWQHERPALAKAVDRVIRYLAGEASIEKYHYDKLLKAMGARLKKFRNPRFEKGDLSQARQWAKNPGESVVIFCMTDVYINHDGEIVNDWMIPASGIRQYDPDRLPKRLKK